MALGVHLAAGEGKRMGQPKALVRDPDGTSWLLRAAAALDQGGCERVVVVLGAGADEAEAMLASVPVDVIVAPNWKAGMSASLRAGLGFLADGDCAVVSLVDLPDVTGEVVRRLIESGTGRDVLARASYDGVAGHPVLLGRHHWPGVLAGATGDRGARDYLATHDHVLVECGDLATGVDVDSLA